VKAAYNELMRILVVDDSATIRLAVKMLLKKKLPEAEIVAANDGKAGLVTLREAPFDLILTDLNMPELDGFGFLEGARKISHSEKTPIIVLTSQTDEKDIDRAFGLGATAFLNKPIVTAELEETIRRLLAR
jgi:two-component system chemotaxis response regulator CheY